MKILGLVGVAGSGKTTLSNLLVNCDWKPTKFATPIKSMIINLLLYQGVDNNIAWRMLYGDLKETPTEYLNNCTPRHAMQTLGTEWRDLIDRNLWIDIWKRSILNYPQDSKIIVDDCRFQYEANVVLSFGGKIIRIERPNNTISSSHISETEMASISCDATILNDANPEKMLDQLAQTLEYWK